MTKISDNITHFIARSRQEWRDWLEANHTSAKGVALVLYKKGAGPQGVTYAEAVEESLCFGWIDGRANPLDADSYLQYFMPLRRKSTWAKSNKIRVEKLTAEGRMTEAGLKVINEAKRDGSWDSLNDIDNLVMPDDLKPAMEAVPAAVQTYFGIKRFS